MPPSIVLFRDSPVRTLISVLRATYSESNPRNQLALKINVQQSLSVIAAPYPDQMNVKIAAIALSRPVTKLQFTCINKNNCLACPSIKPLVKHGLVWAMHYKVADQTLVDSVGRCTHGDYGQPGSSPFIIGGFFLLAFCTIESRHRSFLTQQPPANAAHMPALPQHWHETLSEHFQGTFRAQPLSQQQCEGS